MILLYNFVYIWYCNGSTRMGKGGREVELSEKNLGLCAHLRAKNSIAYGIRHALSDREPHFGRTTATVSWPQLVRADLAGSKQLRERGLDLAGLDMAVE